MTEFFAFLQILHFVQSARCDVGMDKIVIQRKGSVTAASTARTEVTKPDVVMLNTSFHVALACVYGGGQCVDLRPDLCTLSPIRVI